LRRSWRSEADSDYVDLSKYDEKVILPALKEFCDKNPDRKPISMIDDILNKAARLKGRWVKGTSNGRPIEQAAIRRRMSACGASAWRAIACYWRGRASHPWNRRVRLGTSAAAMEVVGMSRARSGDQRPMLPSDPVEIVFYITIAIAAISIAGAAWVLLRGR